VYEEKVWTVGGMQAFIKHTQERFPRANLIVSVSGTFHEAKTAHYMDHAPMLGTSKLGRRQSLLLLLPPTFYHEGRKRIDVPERTVEVLPTFGQRFTVHIDVQHPEFSMDDGWGE